MTADVPTALSLANRLEAFRDGHVMLTAKDKIALCAEAANTIRSLQADNERLQATVNALNEANQDIGIIAQENIKLRAENEGLLESNASLRVRIADTEAGMMTWWEDRAHYWQAENERLKANRVAEAYLQQELRRLHAVIEGEP